MILLLACVIIISTWVVSDHFVISSRRKINAKKMRAGFWRLKKGSIHVWSVNKRDSVFFVMIGPENDLT